MGLDSVSYLLSQMFCSETLSHRSRTAVRFETMSHQSGTAIRFETVSRQSRTVRAAYQGLRLCV